MKSLQLSLLFFLYAATFNVAAVCSFYDGHAQSTVAIDIPNNISIPRDAPNGTIIYESVQKTTNNIFSSYKCTSDFNMGVKNNVGVDTATKLFAIGDTGIAWQWFLDGGAYDGYLSGAMKKAGGYGFNGVSHQIRLVKVGNIKANAKIPTGILGYFKTGEVFPLAMTTNGMAVVAQSCEAPDVQVNMGEHNLSTFSKSGSHSIPTSFSIKLKNCPAGIKKVTYSLAPSPANAAWNVSQGIVELNKNSTSKGVALQVMDSQNQPVELNKIYTFNDYSSIGGNFNIPMAARYFRTLPTGGAGEHDRGMSAGTANTEIAFIMSYL